MSRLRSLACLVLAVTILLGTAACTPESTVPADSGAHTASVLRGAAPEDLARQVERALQSGAAGDLRALVPAGSLLSCTYRGHCNTLSVQDALSRIDEVLHNAQSVQVTVTDAIPDSSAPGALGQVALRVSVQPLVTPDPMNGVYYYETLMVLRPRAEGWEWFAWHVRMPA